MAKAKGMSLLEVQSKFHSEQVCRDHLFQLRRGKAFRAPVADAQTTTT